MAAMRESRRRLLKVCRNRKNTAAPCRRWVGRNLRPTNYQRSQRTSGHLAIRLRPSGINRQFLINAKPDKCNRCPGHISVYLESEDSSLRTLVPSWQSENCVKAVELTLYALHSTDWLGLWKETQR